MDIKDAVARNDIKGKRVAWGLNGSMASAVGLGYLLEVGAHVTTYYAGIGPRQNRRRDLCVGLCSYFRERYPGKLEQRLYTTSIERDSERLKTMPPQQRDEFLSKPKMAAHVALGFGYGLVQEHGLDYLAASIALDWEPETIDMLYQSLCNIEPNKLPAPALYLPFSRMSQTSIFTLGFEWRTPYTLTLDCESGIPWMIGHCRMCDKCKRRSLLFDYVGLKDLSR